MTTITLDLGDVDEALRHLALVPTEQRGIEWRAYMDKCLDLRNSMEHAWTATRSSTS